MKKTLFLLVIFTLSFQINQAQTPAFPTAEGYGKYAKGGRGGKVVFVENLDDYIAYNNMEEAIPGSFRWALKQYPGEPLTIIFRVSGTIMLKPHIVNGRNVNDIRSSRPNLTIAGQTAPGEGITIRNSKVNLGGSKDLIVRNVRFRIGENAADGTFIPGGSMGCENAMNVIFDHCVFGWSGEENITMYDNRFTTVQWSMIHEGLYDDGHGKGNRGYGGQCGGINSTWHHNLFAHNQSRTPRLNGARTENETRVFIEFINNVIFNWGSSGGIYGADVSLGTNRSHTANYIGNYYKPGPATPSTKYFFSNYIVNGATYPKWFLSDNYMLGNAAANTDNWNAFQIRWSGAAGTTLPTKSDLASDTLLYPPKNIYYNLKWIEYEPYRLNTITSAEEAYQSILEKVGTFNRDSVERRIIRELKDGTATFKASLGKYGIIDKSTDAEGYLPYEQVEPPVDTDRDGMPDAWELANGLNPNDPEDRNLKTPEGYTALEVYLNSLMGEYIVPNFTGVKNIKQTFFSIFPTVVKDRLEINSELPLSSVKILSLKGELISENTLKENSFVDVRNLNSGYYLICVKSESNRKEYAKFLKN
ncbi:MAG: T9SS type A sorting domain-containing protein [Porphyromonadaceae bacterium]|nr:T9SS type A sorting domain-containing protein [Porphyromonadaceae bacterium]